MVAAPVCSAISNGQTLACLLVLFFSMLCTSANGALSEEEQLDLLEQANEYYVSEERANDKAVALYEDVLEKVQLAEPIRLEIMFRIANMYLFDMGPDLKVEGNRDVSRALEKYKQIVAEFPQDDVKVFQSHGYIADCHSLLENKPEAEKEYLYVRRFALSLPADQAPKYEPYAKAWKDGALNNIIGLYRHDGPFGVAELRRIMRDNPDDPELVKRVDAAISNMTKAEIEDTQTDTGRMLRDIQDGIASLEKDAINEATTVAEQHVAPSFESMQQTRPPDTPMSGVSRFGSKSWALWGGIGGLAILAAMSAAVVTRNRRRKQ
ncbi:MAG TPA: hypothetical protein HPP77_06065 [Candidatus Hydrogenedentes bacterium]|nr:hypothetical protein [Candidatus Hydrogenedentota bacterium]HIJ72838.1 hypothetical protein [Candidatus Hydrogenedentota bacterium]